MASKCFCDACGAEMPATGSRTIEVRVALGSDPGPKFAVDGRRADDIDICERCICKAFADKIGAMVILCDVQTGPRPPDRPAENFVRLDTQERFTKVVEREPTERMIAAAGEHFVGRVVAQEMWRVMYDAA